MRSTAICIYENTLLNYLCPVLAFTGNITSTINSTTTAALIRKWLGALLYVGSLRTVNRKSLGTLEQLYDKNTLATTN